MIQALGDRVPRLAPDAWVHPQATVIGDVELGPGASVWPGAVLRGDFGSIRVGARTSVQDNAVIHSAPWMTTEVGDECIVAHLAFIEAAVVEDLCMVATGALVLPGATMRSGSVAAAGAALAKSVEVPSGHRAQGVPARVVPSDHPDRAYIAEGVANYVRMAARFARLGVGTTGADLAAGLDLPGQGN